MRRCYDVNFEMKGGAYLRMVFDAMKRVQEESELVDDSTTITYDSSVKLTAGFYKNSNDFEDLFMSVITCDKELIKRHVEKYFPMINDSDVKEGALNNICNSMDSLGKGFTVDEYEELKKLSGVKTR